MQFIRLSWMLCGEQSSAIEAITMVVGNNDMSMGSPVGDHTIAPVARKLKVCPSRARMGIPTCDGVRARVTETHVTHTRRNVPCDGKVLACDFKTYT